MPAHPIKTGTMTTVDLETGQVVEVKQNALTILPCGRGCPECGAEHAWNDPHNLMSLTYQMRFHAKHGRWPTWTDAMAHCDAETRVLWRRELIQVLTKHRQPIPPDLLESAGPPSR